VDDLLPDDGGALGDLRRQLRETYDERQAAFLELTDAEWDRSLHDPGRKSPVTPEYLLIHECVAHDGEHLSQVVGTAYDWRKQQA
jgi:hypothetical protein